MTIHAQAPGFTLMEMAVVLVIIGLLTGGVLVGQDLIKNAEVRAEVAQIEKYDHAVNAFQAKFNAIPGDMGVPTANKYGFNVGTSCDGSQLGFRDGDGLIDGWYGTEPLVQGAGETALFWQDISSPVAGGLIDGSFPNSGGAQAACSAGAAIVMSTTVGTSYIGDYLPLAKIGHGNFVYVYETNGFNWFGVSAVTSNSATGLMVSGSTLPVIQAYNIDKKVDDGLPTTGAVQATYINNSHTTLQTAPNAATDTTTTCYNTTTNVYSMSTYANYGRGGNCALSFRFQ